MIPTFTRSYEASADVTGYLIARFSDAANTSKVANASANNQPLIGVFDRLGASAGGMADVHRAGLAPVRLGGTVQAGDPLTADANGKAIKCIAAAGETRNIVGWAEAPGVADDIIDAFISPGLLHAPAAA